MKVRSKRNKNTLYGLILASWGGIAKGAGQSQRKVGRKRNVGYKRKDRPQNATAAGKGAVKTQMIV